MTDALFAGDMPPRHALEIHPAMVFRRTSITVPHHLPSIHGKQCVIYLILTCSGCFPELEYLSLSPDA
ncbi:protein of unknown function [Candidatus Nitrospira inopinata]|jgi:hypothetical protein|uniref:Uncharacterized protein n=1 Tax=Candidatus Nitrospira inopinata TaxID=1715989 RepID=A0A0S4KQW0_9BACT|nr:protein of unknown function [Candidatus Nitrospira inopinata]